MPSQLAISRDAAKLEGVCIMIDGERETVGLVSGELIHFGTRIVSPRIATERRERHCAGNDLAADAAIANPHIVAGQPDRSEEHTSELQSLMRISTAVFC